MRHLSSHGTSLLIPSSNNSVPCNFDLIITAVFTLSSLVNLWPEWWSLKAGKKWKSLRKRSALNAGCSKIVHLKRCKSCVAVTTWGWPLLCRSKTPVVSIPGRCRLMAAHNCFRVAGCITWCCIDCSLFHEIHQQYTLAVPNPHSHQFTSTFAHLEFSQSQGHGMFPLHVCTFFFRGSDDERTHVSSPVRMHSR